MKISTRKLASAAGGRRGLCRLDLAARTDKLRSRAVPRVGGALHTPGLRAFTAWGLWAGCAIANLAGGYGIPDIVFGSLATLGASLCMAAIAKGRRQPLSLGRAVAVCFMPVIWNGPIVGGVIAYSTGAFWAALPLNSLQIAAEEALVMYVIGLPLLKLLPKSTAFSRAIDDLNNK